MASDILVSYNMKVGNNLGFGSCVCVGENWPVSRERLTKIGQYIQQVCQKEHPAAKIVILNMIPLASGNEFDYETHWNEQMKYLEQGCEFLADMAQETNSPNEKARLEAKREGMMAALYRMQDTVKIYGKGGASDAK